MQECWLEEPIQRPTFEVLVATFENLLSQYHDYNETIIHHENSIPRQQPNVIVHQANGDSFLTYDDIHDCQSIQYDQVLDEASVKYDQEPTYDSGQHDTNAAESIKYDQVPDETTVEYDQERGTKTTP